MLTFVAGLLSAFVDWLRGACPAESRPPAAGDDWSGYDPLSSGPMR
jgi:hypothetical protein